jgi:predicted HAD superfamily Cof-like phosphohydrolase
MTRPNLISDVTEFMSETKLPHPDEPTIEQAQYRPLHIEEEAKEFVDAYRHLMHLIGVHGELRLRTTLQEPYIAAWAQVLDSLVDLTYVAIGCANGLGLDFEEAWKEVHAANMRKIEYKPCQHCGCTGYDKLENPCKHCTTGYITTVLKNANGKVLKPAGWTPPDIHAIIRRQLKL